MRRERNCNSLKCYTVYNMSISRCTHSNLFGVQLMLVELSDGLGGVPPSLHDDEGAAPRSDHVDAGDSAQPAEQVRQLLGRRQLRQVAHPQRRAAHYHTHTHM